MDDEDDYTHQVTLAIDEYFDEQDFEEWTIRRPWDLVREPEGDEDSKQPRKKVKTDVINNASTSVTFSDDTWVQIASFLDPHDIDSLAVSWKAPHSALKYPAPTTISSATTSCNAAPETLPSLRVRLESVFRYFFILKLYADQLQTLQYKWLDIVKLFTAVAKYMQYKYGATYEVHPIHRALVAEGVLERLCNTTTIGRDTTLLPVLHGYGPHSSGDIRGHFHTGAIKVSLGCVPVPILSIDTDTNAETFTTISNVRNHYTIYGDDWVVSLGDPSQLRNTRDPEQFMNAWLQTAQDKHMKDPKIHYNRAEHKAILERRCPVVWLFDYPGDSNGYEVGISVDDNHQTKFWNWSPYYGVDGLAPRFWQRGGPDGREDIKSVAHYLLLYPGVSMGGETLGPAQRLFRLAWLQAHGFPHEILQDDWQGAISSIQEDDDEFQGLGIPAEDVRVSVKAMMIDKDSKLRLANSRDYKA